MPRRSRRLPDPEAVLTGRARVSMEELVALVHRVNPTGRQLPADEEAHRYRQKSELQSLLIARHGDDLVVEQVSEDVVSLRHPHGMADACHAVVGELDEEARAWVRRRLVDATLAEPHEPDRPTAPLDRTVSLDPLARGRVALEEWDYDQARACFEEALSTRPSEEAGHALLDLLVNHLGLDRVALDQRLRVQSERIRRLRALAAGRLGERELAERLLRDLPVAGTAEVRIALADHALRRSDPDDAEAQLRVLREVSPGNAAILRLEEGLRRQRAEVRAPREAQVEEVLRAGRLDEAEALARALRVDFPASEVPSRVLAQVARQRARARAEQWVAEAEAHDADGAPAAALHALQRAAEADPTLDLAPRLARLEAAAQAERDERLVERVVARLRGGDGLAAYTALPTALRDRVRAEVGRDELTWIDALGHPDPRGAAAAVQALLYARACLGADEPAAALSALEPHDRLLRGLGPARELTERARARLDAKAHEVARAQLTACEEALDAGSLATARRVLDALRDVPEDLRGDHQALTELLAEAELEAAFQALVDAGDHLAARDMAAKHGWATRRFEQAMLVRTQWGVRVLPGEAAYADLRDHVVTLPPGEPPTWLGGDGRVALAVDARERWLFIRVIDLVEDRILEVVVLRAPMPLVSPVAQLAGRRLWIWSDRRLLVIDPERWEVVSWVDLGRLCRGETIDGAALDSAGDYLWLRLAGGRHTRVFDTRTWRHTGYLEGGQAVLPVYGSIEPWVALLEGKVVTLHPPHGGRRHLYRHTFGQVGALAVSNQGASCSALSHRNITPEGQIESGTLDDGGGAVGHHVWIPSVDRVRVIATANTTRQALHQVATSRTSETTYVSAVAMGGVRMLVGYVATPEGLEHRWDVHIPSSSVLVHHPEARGVALLVRHARGARWFALDPTAPDLPADVYEPMPWTGDLDVSASVLEGGLLGLARPHEATEAGATAPGLLRAIQSADAAAGPSARIDALDRLEVHQRVELQSRARLAAAWLDLVEEGDRDRYRKLVALTGYLDARRQCASREEVVLSLGQAAWDQRRLDEVAARAEAWLAGWGGGLADA